MTNANYPTAAEIANAEAAVKTLETTKTFLAENQSRDLLEVAFTQALWLAESKEICELLVSAGAKDVVKDYFGCFGPQGSTYSKIATTCFGCK